MGGTVFAALVAALALGRAETAPPVTLARERAADYSPIYPFTELPANQHDFVALARFDNPPKKVRFTLIAVDTNGADPPNQPVFSQEGEHGGAKVGMFRFDTHQEWKLGRYAVEVFADGALLGRAEFVVVAAVPPLAISDPGALLAAEPGTAWHFETALAANPNPGFRYSIKGVEPDAGGMLRMRGTRSVVAREGDLIHMHVARDDTPQGTSEEFWRLDASGYAFVRKVEGGKTGEFAPPQLWIPLPPTPQSWTWHAAAGPGEGQFRLWGPLPIAGPHGTEPGLLVREFQTDGQIELTTELDFIPRLGVVREIDIEAVVKDGRTAMYMATTISPAGGAKPANPATEGFSSGKAK